MHRIGFGVTGPPTMAHPFTETDVAHMKRALSLSLRGQGRVEPNPMVGCVLVREGQVVGEGYHRRYSGPHAEVEALLSTGEPAKGATAYVTLEPCCHHGKTPPCCDALIRAGIAKVCVALRDTVPPVGGRGVSILKKAGLEVFCGLLESQAAQLNAPYLKLRKTGRPYVILKWAQSLDGKIATRTGDSQWISSEPSRRLAHQLRGRVDAIVVGVATVRADDPDLTCRLVRPRRVATRIVLDPELHTPKNARLVRSARLAPTMIVTTTSSARTPRGQAMRRAGVELLTVPTPRGQLDLGRMLDALGARDMTNVMVEGGGVTLGSFFDAGLADEAMVFVSPRLIGGREAISPLGGRGPERMKEVPQPVWTARTSSGGDDVYRIGLTKPA